MTYLNTHAGWIAFFICYAAILLWITYEMHKAPTLTDEEDDLNIDDFYNH